MANDLQLPALTDDASLSQQLLDAAPDAIVAIDERGRIVLVNLQTERLFGWPRHELLGQYVEVLIPQRYHGAHVQHREHYARAPRARPMGSGVPLFGRKRDGSEFFAEISLSPLQTQHGMLTMASVRDITDRKQIELRMRHVQEHLLSAVESIQGAYAIFDSDERLVLCNSEFQRWLGARVEGNPEGRTVSDLMESNLSSGAFDPAPDSVASLYERWRAYHREPVGSFSVRAVDGRRLRLVERRTQEGGTLMTIWDVTEEVLHEEELRKTRAAAEAANSAKSEFLASMSHELRTPLNAILGFAQLLHRDKKNPLSERHRERVEHVIRGGEHLLRLIDDVLDLSRVEAGRVTVSLEPVEIPDALNDITTTLQPMAARAEIELMIAPYPADLVPVMADRIRFKQVLTNYGSNAIKYGKKGGKVSFNTTVQDGCVRISVEDDGLGIVADKQDKIFEPFHRAGQETGPIEGTGIGLAITKRLAELMRGRVGFRSQEGIGSEFWIELPSLARADSSASARRATSANATSWLTGSEGESYLVVYIEDNPSNIAFMEDLLADYERVTLLTAPTAEVGIEMVRARQPNLVIMDIHLPGMSGLEANRLLREWPETRHIPVIALSAAAMVRDAARVRDAGFHAYLTKPVKVDELAAVLEKLLTRP